MESHKEQLMNNFQEKKRRNKLKNALSTNEFSSTDFGGISRKFL